MNMGNQRGVTLIELLAVIALLSVVTVPLFAAFSDSYKRTVEQGEETQLLHYAASVMEEMQGRTDLSPDTTVDGIYFEKGECQADRCYPTNWPDQLFPTYAVQIKPYAPYEYPGELLEIEVLLFPAQNQERQSPVRLVTVVAQP